MAEKPDDPELTPEKQLLKLIEDPDSENISSAKNKYKAKGFFSFGFLKGRFSFLRGRKQAAAGGKHEIALDIGTINLILKLTILGLAVYLAMDSAKSMQNLKTMPNLFMPGPGIVGKETGLSEVRSNLKPLSRYIDKMKARNIFSPEVYKEPEEIIEIEEEKKKEEASSKATEFLQSLQLVGVSWSGGNPDVIIEHTKTSRTYFLKKGDSFAGAKVQDVFPDRVIINYEGEEMELR